MARKHSIIVRIVGGLALLVVVLMAALLIALATFDWNRAKPYINQKVSDEIGRPFAINGDLRVQWRREGGEHGIARWVPWPRMSAEDITVGNVDWAKAPQFASLRHLEFAIAPLPLIGQRVVIRHLAIAGPSVDLERRKDGQANWNFTFKKDDQADQKDQASKWALDIDQINFDKGNIAYRDEILDADIQGTVDPLGQPIPFSQIAGAASTAAPAAKGRAAPGQPRSAAPAGGTPANAPASAPSDAPANAPATAQEPQYAFGWQVKGKYKGVPLNGDGKIGGVLALKSADQPFPVQADAHYGATRATIVGTLTDPMKLGALDLRLTLAGKSMSDLYPLTGVTLPDTPPYRTDGHLSAHLQDPATFDYQNFNGKVGESDIHGSVRFVNGKPRPKLTGKLTSNLLRFVDLGPLVGAPTGDEPAKKPAAQPTAAAGKGATASKAASTTDKAASAGKPAPDNKGAASTPKAKEGAPEDVQPPDKALPVQKFRTERWNAMDADVTLDAKRILKDPALPITDLQAHLMLDNAMLTLRPLRFGVAGGSLNSDIKLDGSRTPMPADIKMQARKIQLKALFPTVKSMEKSLGELNGDAAISGNGNSVAELLASSNGELKLLVSDGVISRGLMELAGLNVGNYVVGKLFGDEQVPINCAALDAGIKDGLFKTNLFIFDTENALIDVDGNIDFKTEKIDLSITPHSKGLRVVSLRSPLYVRGTLKKPDAGVKMAPLIARGAGMVVLGAALTPVAGLLALVVPSTSQAKQDNQCTNLLEQMKQPPKAPPPKAGGRPVAKPSAAR